MKTIATLTLTAAALATATVQAAPTDRMMAAAVKLQQLEDGGFKATKPAEIKALRAEFKTALDASLGQARSNAARLTTGKSPAEVDKALREADKKAGTPAEVVQIIDSMGGPFKVLQQTDRIAADFGADVLSGSQQFAYDPRIEHILLALLGIGEAQAKFKKTACMAFMWAASLGTGADAAYRLCKP